MVAFRDSSDASLAPDSRDNLAEARRHLITALRANQRAQAHADAIESMLLRTAYEICKVSAEGRSQFVLEHELKSIALEIGIETRTNDRTVMSRIDDAWFLHERFDATALAFRQGDLTRRHVAVIVECGSVLEDEDARREYERQVLERAADTAPAPLARFARRVAAELSPKTFAERHEEAVKGRNVRVRDLDDGMSELIAYLPSTIAHAIHDRLTQLASANVRARDAFGFEVGDRLAAQAEAGDPAAMALLAELGDEPVDSRRYDEIRADSLTDLLLAGQLDPSSPHAAINSIQARVAITVPALTLAGVSDEPAMLEGVSPIPIDTAMRLCGGASQWTRVLTDPLTGEAVAADTYRPSAALRRFIETRDRTCRTPGCRRPARDCDIDHNVEWANGGRTVAGNLAALCRYHHTLRHRGWVLAQGRRGALTWVSPAGRRHTNYPERAARPRGSTDDDPSARSWSWTSGYKPYDPSDPAPF